MVIIRSTFLPGAQASLTFREKMIVFTLSQIPVKPTGLKILTGNCGCRHGLGRQQLPVMNVAIAGTDYRFETNLSGIGMR